MWAASYRPGWWNSRQYNEAEAEDDFRIPINRTGLTPWQWGGLRGEMVALALVFGFVMLIYFHWWEAALIGPLVILIVAKRLHKWHPFWIELFVRLLIQPAGFQDS